MTSERPAPLILAVAPLSGEAAFGTHDAVAAAGQRLLAAELSQRLGALGAAVAPLVPQAPPASGGFRWGPWFADAAREALARARREGRALDAIGYVGAGSLCLVDDAALDDLLAPLPGEVVANNRFSADAFVVAGAQPTAAPDGTARRGLTLERALEALEECPTDNGAVRALEEAGFTPRDLAGRPWSRFDVDTTLDLALLRLSTRLPGIRRPAPAVLGFLEMARLPLDRPLLVPHLEEIGAVIRDRSGELVVAGRIPSSVLRELETEAACRVRAFVEERGMRSARTETPRSLLAGWVAASGAASLIEELASLGDAVVLDSRVIMGALAGSAEADRWPPREERFASDFADPASIRTPWLAELAAAVRSSPVPILTGGHALVSDGLRLLLGAAWVGR